MGAGMVNRNVFRHVDYDPDEWSGFAFGIGIERVAMIDYNIDDIRLFYEMINGLFLSLRDYRSSK